jgi:adenylate cyclase
VLVDYIGDEMMAMWGAPRPQPDQAERAARAALAMLRGLEDLNKRWAHLLGPKPMDVGIGLNTGAAQVGNVGSDVKYKYGALGNTVNVGSRVQGFTKFLKRRLLVTRAMRERLGDTFVARRVCQTRFVNIDNPVDLYEVDLATPERREFFQASEEALNVLEKRNFALAARRAGELLGQHRGDGPLLLVLSRAAEALRNDGEGFDPVWMPPGK